jgi:hypothetical protein
LRFAAIGGRLLPESAVLPQLLVYKYMSASNRRQQVRATTSRAPLDAYVLVLATAAAIWRNTKTGAASKRSLIAYDH